MTAGNSVNLIGRLTRDPELKYLSNGTPLVEFSLCINKKSKVDGVYEDSPHFFDCKLFGKRAEVFHQYMFKGKQVAVDGELSQERWNAPDGTNRSKIRVVCHGFTFIGSKSDDLTGGQPAQGFAPAPQQPQQAQQQYQQPSEEVPF